MTLILSLSPFDGLRVKGRSRPFILSLSKDEGAAALSKAMR
jgi:hypothetical protein